MKGSGLLQPSQPLSVLFLLCFPRLKLHAELLHHAQHIGFLELGVEGHDLLGLILQS